MVAVTARIAPFALTALLKLIGWILKSLRADAQGAFIRSVVESVTTANKSATLAAFVAQTPHHNWSASEKEVLFASSCQLFNPVNLPDSAIEHFKQASGSELHYSQEGEDIVLMRLLGDRSNGFFVDVGAHHPTRFSNTYALYRKGWRGINIDATPGSMTAFTELRPHDTNLEAAISDQGKPLIFSVFKEGALNTFDQALAKTYIDSGWPLSHTVELTPTTLAEVLNRHVKPDQKIDIFSIDVEGEDLGVLKSNDWEKYSPEFVVIEALDTPLLQLTDCEAVIYLRQKGFTPVSRLFNSIILRRVNS